jgi:hypothetical protein
MVQLIENTQWGLPLIAKKTSFANALRQRANCAYFRELFETSAHRHKSHSKNMIRFHVCTPLEDAH